MFYFHWLLVFGALTIALPAQAVVCPPAQKDLIKVRVKETISYEATSKLYSYYYEIINEPESRLDITQLLVDITGEVSDIIHPQGWVGDTIPEQHFKNHALGAVSWHATDNVPSPPGKENAAGFLPFLYPIKPGSSMSGFSFKSPKPPGPAKFYVQDYVHLPSAPNEEEAETISNECPPEVVGDIFETSYQGTTQGPVDYLPITVDIRPRALNPKSQGVIPVVILSTADFDASSVDPLSVRFAAGGAQEAHQTGHSEDANGDGKNDLMLHFSLAAAGIQCGDSYAELSGATQSGQTVRGMDAFVTVGCK